MAEQPTHRVRVKPPGEPARAVLCGLGSGKPECLTVVARHQQLEPEGTEIEIEERVGGRFVPRVLWFRARGRWHRTFYPADGPPSHRSATTKR